MILFFSLIGFLSCQSNSDKNISNDSLLIKKNIVTNTDLSDVSMLNLIVDPQSYNHKRVRVIGYLNLEFEGNGLYFHKEDYDNSICKNGLWVDMSRDSMRLPNIKKLIKNYVIVEGTFDTKTGHMGAWGGSIEKITRLEAWEPTVSPVEKKSSVHFPLSK